MSYSHKDLAFVRSLCLSLTRLKYDVWVDWEKIGLTDDWQQLVQQGIQLADLCILATTPSFLASRGCTLETEYILSTQKPILLVLLYAELLLPELLLGCDLVYVENPDSIDESLPKLVKAISKQLKV